MLKRFTVENYRNLGRRITVDFSKTRQFPFNAHLIRNGLIDKMVIIGNNGCGKTNLGHAIMDITKLLSVHNCRDDADEVCFLNGDSDLGYATFAYEFQFGCMEITYEYRKTGPKTIVYERFDVNGSMVFLRDGTSISNTGLSDYGIQNIDLGLEDANASMLGYIAVFSNQQPESPFKITADFVRGMRYIGTTCDKTPLGSSEEPASILEYFVENDLVADFSSFLQESAGLDLNLDVIESDHSSKNVVLKTRRDCIPFDRIISEGTKSLMILYYWMKRSTGTTFAFIDDFGANYHYRLSDSLFNLIAEKASFQTVFTTHNLNLISNYMSRPDCCWHMIDGTIHSLPDMTDRELREGHNMEHLMRGGEFDEPPSRAQY